MYLGKLKIMKIKKNQTQYGVVNYVEVAGIDTSKDKTYSIFDPPHMSFSKYAGQDIRMKKLQSSSPDEKEDYGYYYNSVYCLPLEEFNKDWHIVNKDFEPENKYLAKMKKEQFCPIAVANTTFMKWFVAVYPCLNDEWKAGNVDYMAMMDKRILENNQKMLQAFKNQDIKEIRVAVKLAADINFEQNACSALQYTIENQNQDLMKYLINKKVKIPQEVLVDEDNAVYDLFTSYVKINSKKLKM